MTSTIKAIEAKGYAVVASENRWMGKLDEECPTVYKILNPDNNPVYGANGIAPEELANWLESLEDLNETAAMKPTVYTADTAENAKKEKEYDNLYNEGGEGYNPYRA